MKTSIKKIVTLAVAMFASIALFAQDAQKPSQSPQEIINNFLATGADGSSTLVTDDEGNIKTVYVVGVAALPKAMSAAMAERFASQRALANAQTTMSNLFNTKVEARMNANEEMILKEKGSAAGDEQGQGSSESTSVSTMSNEFKSMTKSAQSGLQMLAANPNRDGRYVAVYAWNVKRAKAIAQVAKTMAENAVESAKAAKELEKVLAEDEKPEEATANDAAKKAPAVQMSNQSREGTFKAPRGNDGKVFINTQDL